MTADWKALCKACQAPSEWLCLCHVAVKVQPTAPPAGCPTFPGCTLDHLKYPD